MEDGLVLLDMVKFIVGLNKIGPHGFDGSTVVIISFFELLDPTASLGMMVLFSPFDLILEVNK